MLRKGDVVILTKAMLGNEVGTIGVCFDEYKIGNHIGASFIFENGYNDGFSEEEQEMFLFKVDFDYTTESYRFDNVIKLNEDYISGFFHILLPSDERKMQYRQKMRDEKINSLI